MNDLDRYRHWLEQNQPDRFNRLPGGLDQSGYVEVEREWYESGALKRERVKLSKRLRAPGPPSGDPPGCFFHLLALLLFVAAVVVGWKIAGIFGAILAIFMIGIWANS